MAGNGRRRSHVASQLSAVSSCHLFVDLARAAAS
jgi:hypothetical protein